MIYSAFVGTTYAAWSARTLSATFALMGMTEYSLCLRPGMRRCLAERWVYQLSRPLMRIANRPTVHLARLHLGAKVSVQLTDSRFFDGCPAEIVTAISSYHLQSKDA
jgi:hypothetical protein